MSEHASSNAWLNQAWAVAPTLHAVEVEGAAIRYRAWSLGRGDLPGLVLVHGFRAHARWWDHIAPSLARQHQVVALDFSGMGDSERRPAYSRVQHAREILAVCDHAGLQTPTLVAHSFGGSVSLIACNLAPERIGRAILLDSFLFPPGHEDRQIPLTPQRVFPSFEAAMERFRLIPPGQWPYPEIMDYIARHSVCETDGGWTWKFDAKAPASLNLERFAHLLRGVRTPVRFLYGEFSEVVTPEVAALAPDLLPTAGAPIVIPQSHHHVMIERPLALIAALNVLLA